MIIDAILNGFIAILNGFISLLPGIPLAPSFSSEPIVQLITTCGYMLPIESMLATFVLGLAIKNWELVISSITWIWERIPFN